MTKETSKSNWLSEQKHHAGHLVTLTVVFGTLNGILLVVQAWYLARVLNAVIIDGAGIEAVRNWLWSMLAIFIIRALLTSLAEHTGFRAAARVKIAVRDQFYRRIQVLGPAFLAGERSGALSEYLTKGVEDLEGYFARYLPAMSLTATIPLTIFIAILPLDWLSALIMIATAPLIPLFMILIGRSAERLNREQWRELTRMGAHFLDVIQGITTLKLFNASRREAATVARISEDYRVSTMGVLRVAFLSSAVLEFFATMGIAIVAVLIGFRLYHIDLPFVDFIGAADISFLIGMFVLMLAPEFYLPLRNLGTHYHGRMEAVAAAERISEILAAPVPETHGGGQDLPAGVPLSIACRDVEFSYEPGRMALCDLTLEIEPGERVAIVGRSGAGKSTLFDLLLGFITPDAGSIRVAGCDLAALDRGRWHAHLAWVPQTPRLFQGTIGDNIRLGVPDASPEAVAEAARRARADGFIDLLPLRYDTPVGEGGSGLSGGQIQRIALARAFLRDAPLVLLDEATASLDPESEALIQAGIDELARGRTLIAIAHRLATVRRADRILVFDAGRLVEAGTHATLAARDGPYRRMLESSDPSNQMSGPAR